MSLTASLLIFQVIFNGVIAPSSSSFSVTFHGITDTLKSEDQQYATALLTAAEAFEEAETLFDDDDFVARKGWTKETETSDGDGVYSKYTPNGKMYTISTVLEGNVDDIVNVFWTGLESQHTWDSMVDYASVIVSLTNYSEIVTFGSNDVLIFTGRDFVAARLYRPLNNGGYRLVGRSVTIDEMPERDDKIRAHCYLGASQFRPHPNDPKNRTLYDLITQGDIKGMIPKFIVNQIAPRVMVMDAENKLKHFKEVATMKNKRYDTL